MTNISFWNDISQIFLAQMGKNPCTICRYFDKILNATAFIPKSYGSISFILAHNSLSKLELANSTFPALSPHLTITISKLGITYIF